MSVCRHELGVQPQPPDNSHLVDEETKPFRVHRRLQKTLFVTGNKLYTHKVP